MVATAHPVASQVGVEILKKWGNAVDAAVACAFALGVVEPYASGIGGGGFMLVYLAKSKEVAALDYRETAPGSVKAQQLKGDQMKVGARSVAVPGTVAGLTLALEKWGRMDLATVMEPAIRLAEDGVVVEKLLAGMMRNQSAKLSRFPEAARTYLKNGDRTFKEGDRIYQKDLATTYRLIAEKGPDAFYRGKITRAIDKQMKRSGGWLNSRDLADYRPIQRNPVKGMYRGYEIFSMPPPSSGGVLIIEMLHILQGYDLVRKGHNSVDAVQIMAEAMRRIFADRTRFMGDPDFVHVPEKALLSEPYAVKVRAGIEEGKINRKIAMPNPAAYESTQTTHVSVVDEEGNLVALTQTLNSFFGSGMVVPGTGILLNNEMSDFTAEKGQPNSIAPGKRPISSISPTIVLKDGKPYLTIGMAGATRIISGLPQILVNMIDYKMDIQKAIDAPRIHCHSEEISLESRIPPRVRKGLVDMGYGLDVRKAYDLYFGGAQGVMIDQRTGALQGGADPRRAGSVVGY
jgi:gamma-glutamyltranspeptidase/glutathione hydrolase